MYGIRQTGFRWTGETVVLPRRPLIVAVTAAFLVQAVDAVWLNPDNRTRIAFSKIEGDPVDPEYGLHPRVVAWLSNRAKLGFKKVTT